MCGDDDLADHAVICETVATNTSGVSGRRQLAPGDAGERRIVGLRFKNLGIVGAVPQNALNALTALREINFSSDPTKPFANDIVLPTGTACVAVNVCKTILCNFGNSAPSCYSPEPTATGLSVAAITGIIIGSILAFVFACCLIIVVYSRRQAEAKRRRRKQKKKESKMRQERGDTLTSNIKRRISMGMGAKKGSARKIYRPKGDVQQPGSAGTWVQTFDPISGAQYWTNIVTGEFSWTPPQQQQSLSRGYAQSMNNPMFASASLPREGYAFRGAPGGFGSVGTPYSNAAGLPALPSSRPFGGGGGPPPPGGGSLRSYGSQSQFPPILPQSRIDRWEEVYDSATDRSYWVSATTGQVSYTPPPGMV